MLELLEGHAIDPDAHRHRSHAPLPVWSGRRAVSCGRRWRRCAKRQWPGHEPHDDPGNTGRLAGTREPTEPRERCVAQSIETIGDAHPIPRNALCFAQFYPKVANATRIRRQVALASRGRARFRPVRPRSCVPGDGSNKDFPRVVKLQPPHHFRRGGAGLFLLGRAAA